MTKEQKHHFHPSIERFDEFIATKRHLISIMGGGSEWEATQIENEKKLIVLAEKNKKIFIDIPDDIVIQFNNSFDEWYDRELSNAIKEAPYQKDIYINMDEGIINNEWYFSHIKEGQENSDYWEVFKFNTNNKWKELHDKYYSPFGLEILKGSPY